MFEQFGIKEVANMTLYSIELDKYDREVYVPVLYFDTLKVSSSEQTADQTSARGGQGNAELISWDYGKEITVSLEDALYTPASQSLMWGGKFGTQKQKIKGLWNPYVYPKDRYGRTQYVKRVKLEYRTLNEARRYGLYREDIESAVDNTNGLIIAGQKVTTPMCVGPFAKDQPDDISGVYFRSTTPGFLDGEYEVGNTNSHQYDIEKITTDDEESYGYEQLRRYFTSNGEKVAFWKDLTVYTTDPIYYRRLSMTVADSSEGTISTTQLAEPYYFLYITADIIDAYERIFADMKAIQLPSDDTELTLAAATFFAEFENSIKYMKNHQYEIAALNEAHLVSEIATTNFLAAAKEFEPSFNRYSEVAYGWNACGTERELMLYTVNDGLLKYKDVSETTSNLICPLGYKTIEKKDNMLNEINVYNWSDISGTVSQSDRPERAEIIIDNYGGFEYKKQSMEVVKAKKNILGNYQLVKMQKNSTAPTVYKRADSNTRDNNLAFLEEYRNYQRDYNNYILQKQDIKIYFTLTGFGKNVNEDTTLNQVLNSGMANQVRFTVGGKTYVDIVSKSFETVPAKSDWTAQEDYTMDKGWIVRLRTIDGTKYRTMMFPMLSWDTEYIIKQSTYNSTQGYIVIPAYYLNNSATISGANISSVEQYTSTFGANASANLQAIVNYSKQNGDKPALVSSRIEIIANPNDTETLANLDDFCLYGQDESTSLNTCTNSKTAHSYIWADADLKMISFEGDQDIYLTEHNNIRYRLPQNSSIKEISVAQRGFYSTIAEDAEKTTNTITFSYQYRNSNGTIVSRAQDAFAIDLRNYASAFVSALKTKNGKVKITNSSGTTGTYEIIDSGNINFASLYPQCNVWDFGEIKSWTRGIASSIDMEGGETITYSYTVVVDLSGGIKNRLSWDKADNNEIVAITSLNRQKTQRESYGHFMKDYSPIVEYYKIIRTMSISGDENIIRVPLGKFYIMSDWNYNGATAVDFPYALNGGMEDTKVLDMNHEYRATHTFAINTARNLAMYNYSNIPEYSNTNLTVYLDPRTMRPYEPNADSFVRQNGDVIEGPLRIIHQNDIYYKWTRTVAPDHNSLGTTITVDATHFPGAFRLVGETYARRREDHKDTHYQIDIPLAKLSPETNLTLQADGDPTTFTMNFRVLRKDDGQMVKLTQYETTAAKFDGYTSGSEEVIPVDQSMLLLDNEIAQEVNAI